MVNVITPQEVRKLPEGSKIREHSIDRQGYPQYLYPGEVWPMKRDRALQVEGHGFGKIIGG